MVADRNPFVVGQQGVVRPEQSTDVAGMVDTDIEIGVVTDSGGQENVDLRQRGEEPGNGLLVLCPLDEQRCSALRRAPRGPDPRANRALSVPCAAASAAACASPVSNPDAASPRRSRTASPIRTTPWGASCFVTPVLPVTTPNGRFCNGKSLVAPAEVTQLRERGSCVTSSEALARSWLVRVESLRQTAPAVRRSPSAAVEDPRRMW